MRLPRPLEPRRKASRLVLLNLLFINACSPNAAEGPETLPPVLPEPGPAKVTIGVPAGDDGLDFAALIPDGELRLQTFGQGGTHVLLGIRGEGFGKRAFVSLTLENSQTGAQAVSPAPVRPQLFYCHDDNVCDLVPILAMASGLVRASEESDGLRILVHAKVHNAAGVQAEATQTALLSTADL